MSRGNTATKVPPNPTSQTSCQDQSGPIAATTCRRSSGVLATNQCSIPAPKLRPSRTTYTISIKLTMAYHVAIIQSASLGGLVLLSGADDHCFVRTAADLTTLQKKKEQTEHKIDADEANQRKNCAAAAHHFAVAVARLKNAVD